MDYALEQGVNFFDTAEMYPFPHARNGSNRKIMELGLKKQEKREEVVWLQNCRSNQTLIMQGEK
jgi:aryl-alcohol dehydrogenase-like predicted oxidoreductase